MSIGYVLAGMARACMSREFAVLARNESRPIVDWLRALCRHAHRECGCPGVGAIGTCLTGNFALMVDESVVSGCSPLVSLHSRPRSDTT